MWCLFMDVIGGNVFLSEGVFEIIIDNAPLISIDLIVLCNGKYLLGKRINRPSRGCWFVPGW